jgi:calcineurin-like phosphoesterase family protein
MSIEKYLHNKVFFTSDLHFTHTNFLLKQYGKRHEVFGYDPNNMDAELIKRWNEKVPVDADVFVLGDLGFSRPPVLNTLVESLNGRIHLIMGNHDRYVKFNNIASVSHYKEIEVANQFICMMHYPLYTWNQSHRGSWALCGHEHGNINSHTHMNTYKIMDVGVDCHPNYQPFSFGEIAMIMANRISRTHHNL